MGNVSILKVRSGLRQMIASMNYQQFHNRVRPDINVLYIVHHHLAKTARVVKGVKITPDASEAGGRLREQGFYVLRSRLPESEVRKIAAQTDSLLTKGHPDGSDWQYV